MKIILPSGARRVLDTLEQSGYEAYAVGGCVRDSLLGKKPHDWDLAADASPEELLRCFQGYRTITDGIRHGTVGVVLPDGVYEVTSFRTDGEYTDHRHPKQVRFVRSLEEDLARRDFTINAMAYHPERGLVDLFGGQRDLQEKTIRCVGDAKTRYCEDALRILRALRFASVLGFSLERDTAFQAKECREQLAHIAPERIYTEFLRLLCGEGAAAVLREFAEVAAVFLPELKPAFGFCQHSPYHIYDVWEHTLHVVENTPAQPELRLAALFHDLAKPACFTLDSKGRGHFYGHPEQGAKRAVSALSRLKAPKTVVRQVELLVRMHERNLLPTESSVRRALWELGGEQPLRSLLALQRADALAKAPDAVREQIGRLDKVRVVLLDVLDTGQCYCRKMLAVDGKDLQALGARGKTVGDLLAFLLDEVLDGALQNQRESLLAAAAKWLEK